MTCDRAVQYSVTCHMLRCHCKTITVEYSSVTVVHTVGTLDTVGHTVGTLLTVENSV